MKTVKTITLIIFLLQGFHSFSQVQSSSDVQNETPTASPVFQNPVQDLLKISRIDPKEYNRAEIYNRQGTLVSSKVITGPELRIDIQNLTDGIYILLLRSTSSLKEKSIKFVVSK
jgi:hypothetical protein